MNRSLLAVLLLLSPCVVRAWGQSISPRADVGTTSTNEPLFNLIFGANNAIPTGDHDTVIGVNAGKNLTTAREMTILGAEACESFTGALKPSPVSENGLVTCIGSYAGANMTSAGAGSLEDVLIGQKSAFNAKSLGAETILGVQAGTSLISGLGDVIIGAHAMYSSGGGYQNALGNTVIGAYAANGVGTKTGSVILGYSAASHLQNASQVNIMGTGGRALLNASHAVLIGDRAGDLGTELQYGVIVGTNAGLYDPDESTIVGAYAGQTVTAAQSSFFGMGAGGQVTNGTEDTCLGYYACGRVSNGSRNTAVGWNAGGLLAGSEYNTVSIGTSATTAAGIDNAVQIGAGTNQIAGSFQVGSTQVVDGNKDLHVSTTAPASNAVCTVGAIRVASPYVYACVAANTWMRAALAAF